MTNGNIKTIKSKAGQRLQSTQAYAPFKTAKSVLFFKSLFVYLFLEPIKYFFFRANVCKP